MKKLLILPVMLILILASIRAVYSLPYCDQYDAGGLYMHGGLFGWDMKSWTFPITKDGLIPEIQNIAATSLTLNFTAPQSRWDWSEFAHLNIGNNDFFWEVGTGDASFKLSSITMLSHTGRMDAPFTGIWGILKFNSSLLIALNADGTLPDTGTSPIPEPAAILLFGTGLAGLAFITRRSQFLNKLK